jgi:hypothetical protein
VMEKRVNKLFHKQQHMDTETQNILRPWIRSILAPFWGTVRPSEKAGSAFLTSAGMKKPSETHKVWLTS